MTEDQISDFIPLSLMPQIYETPIEIIYKDENGADTGEFIVKRLPSMFTSLPHSKIVGNPELENLLVEMFITNGRLLHQDRVLSFFPEYLKLNTLLMHGLLND